MDIIPRFYLGIVFLKKNISAYKQLGLTDIVVQTLRIPYTGNAKTSFSPIP
jgi:hypothetical protein